MLDKFAGDCQSSADCLSIVGMPMFLATNELGHYSFASRLGALANQGNLNAKSMARRLL